MSRLWNDGEWYVVGTIDYYHRAGTVPLVTVVLVVHLRSASQLLEFARRGSFSAHLLCMSLS